MKHKPNRNWVRRTLLAMLCAAPALIAFDYFQFHARDSRALKVVSELGGRAGSILGWPFGKEYTIAFARPLSTEELERLSVLDSQVGRNAVMIYFNCDMTSQQLDAARRALPHCRVIQGHQPEGATDRKRVRPDASACGSRPSFIHSFLIRISSFKRVHSHN